MTLHGMGIGEMGEVVGYHAGHAAYRAKLLALGLTRGARFRLISIAPLGDPVGIEVRGFHLSLRKDEAAILKIRLVRAQGEAG